LSGLYFPFALSVNALVASSWAENFAKYKLYQSQGGYYDFVVKILGGLTIMTVFLYPVSVTSDVLIGLDLNDKANQAGFALTITALAYFMLINIVIIFFGTTLYIRIREAMSTTVAGRDNLRKMLLIIATAAFTALGIMSLNAVDFSQRVEDSFNKFIIFFCVLEFIVFGHSCANLFVLKTETVKSKSRRVGSRRAVGRRVTSTRRQTASSSETPSSNHSKSPSTGDIDDYGVDFADIDLDAL